MVNLSDIFRSIFGPPKERLCPNELPRSIQEDFEKLYGVRPDLHWRQQPPTNVEEWQVLYGHPEHDQHMDEFREGDFLQEFEQMFKNIFKGFSLDFTPPLQGPPSVDLPADLPSQLPQEHFPNHSESLRDRMLRGPDSSPQVDDFEHQHEDSRQSEGLSLFHPFSLFGDVWRLPFGGLRCPDEQVDRDLDGEVEMGTRSLDDILEQTNEGQMLAQPVPPSSLSSSLFSSVTVDSNGITEQRTRKRDSTGKEEVIITRRIGDQTHTVIQRKDESGNEETQEDLVNIDSGGLEEFNEKWHHSKRGDGQTPLSSIFESILEHFFPKR